MGAVRKQISSLGRNTALTHVVAIDCEMVGVGPNGDQDSLARVSIVSVLCGSVGWQEFGGREWGAAFSKGGLVLVSCVEAGTHWLEYQS